MLTIELQADKRRLRLIVESDLKSTNVDEVRAETERYFEETSRDAYKTVYLDLRNSKLVDSMALNWIFMLIRDLKSHQKSMVIQISSPAVRRVFEFANIEGLAEVKYRKRRQV